VIDILTGQHAPITLAEDSGFDYLGVGNMPLGWSTDGLFAYMIAVNEGNKTLQLVEVALATGATRVVVEETSATSVTVGHNLMSPNVRTLGKHKELIWYSERDGWGHLYLYDITTGQLKRRLTGGSWTVLDIVRVDEKNRVVFFTAGGREFGRDPYYRHLYRVSLDDGDVVLLTPADADHEFSGRSPLHAGSANTDPLSPTAEYVIDTFSTVDTAPVSVLRSALDGRLITKLEEADASALYAAGYQAPRRFSVLSADANTRLYGVLNLPSDFDPDKSYPVIDAIYGGPVSVVAARSFRGAYSGIRIFSRLDSPRPAPPGLAFRCMQTVVQHALRSTLFLKTTRYFTMQRLPTNYRANCCWFVVKWTTQPFPPSLCS